MQAVRVPFHVSGHACDEGHAVIRPHHSSTLEGTTTRIYMGGAWVVQKTVLLVAVDGRRQDALGRRGKQQMFP